MPVAVTTADLRLAISKRKMQESLLGFASECRARGLHVEERVLHALQEVETDAISRTHLLQ